MKNKKQIQTKESESSYRFLAEHTADGLFRATIPHISKIAKLLKAKHINLKALSKIVRFRFSYVSSQVHDLLGYTPNEFMKLNFQKIVTPESFAKVAEVLAREILLKLKYPQKALRRATITQLEMIRRDGRTIWTEGHTNFVGDVHDDCLDFLGVVHDISDRKRAEERLQASEAQFRSLVENALISIYKTNIKGELIYANPIFWKTFGFSSLEDFNKHGGVKARYVHPKDRQELIRLISKGSSVNRFETYLKRKDGTSFHALISASLSGETLSGTIMDMSWITEYQNELLKFKLGFERSDQIIFMADPNANIIYVNPAFEKKYGYSEKEVLGKNPRFLKSGMQSPSFYKHFWATLLAKKSVNAEIFNKDKKGRLLNIKTSVNPILDDRQKIIGFLALQTDITKKRKIERQLEESEAQYRDIVENSPDMIHAVDRDGRILFANRKEYELLGYKEGELIGKSVKMLYQKQLLTDVQSGFKELQKKGKLYIPEGKMIKKNGEILDVEIDSIAIYDSKGNFIRTRSIIRDVTDRKRTALELKKKVDQMEFMGRLNLRRYKKMLEMQREIISLKQRLGEIPPTLEEVQNLYKNTL